MWTWLGATIVFALGGAAGYFAARQTRSQRTRQLEEELAQTRLDLSTYRSQVDRHFHKTSTLFSKLTDNYREVYEHLAYGAQTLTREKLSTSPLNLPRKRIYADTVGTWSGQPSQAPEAMNLVEARDSTAPSADRAHKPAAIQTGTASAPTEEIGTIESAPEITTATEAETAGVSTAAATEPGAEAESVVEPDAEAEIEEIHLGVESAPGMDFEHRQERSKTPSSFR